MTRPLNVYFVTDSPDKVASVTSRLARDDGGPRHRHLESAEALAELLEGSPDPAGGTLVVCTPEPTAAGCEQQESAAYLDLVSDHLPILIAYIDSERRFRFVNRTGAIWLAHSPRKLIGKAVEEIAGAPALISEACMRKALRGERARLELSLSFSDGNSRDVQVTHVPDTAPDGTVRGFVAMVADVSERTTAMRELRESEAYIRTVADNVADALISIDEHGRIESFNAAAERYFGYDSEEAIGRNVSMLMPPHHRHRHDGYLGHYLETGESRLLGHGPRELAGQRKDGSLFPLELSIAEAVVGQRRIFVGAARDISARKQAQDALRNSEELFRTAVTAAPHGIAVVGLDGRWQMVNAAMARILGYSEQELLELDWQAMTHPEDRPASIRMAQRLLAGEIGFGQLEKRYVRKDGKVIPAQVSVGLVRGPDNEPLRYITQVSDLSERKKIEAELLQARKMEAIGQLTGGIAHDFNNLLTVILGNARLMASRIADEDDPAAARLSQIISAAQSGADLTRRLMSFGRKDRHELRVVPAGKTVADMLGILQRTLGEQIRIDSRFEGKPIYMLVDPTLLQSALLNLATNARDAMPDGGTLTILVSAVRDRRAPPPSDPRIVPGGFVRIAVSDTGCGIDAADRDRIFEPFYTTKEVGKGSGMGLSMVFGFVEQSGGRIMVDSEPGLGTTIQLWLPKAFAAEDARAGTGEGDAEAPAGGGKGTILVVEDQERVRAIAVAILDELGYRVIEAENGPDAVKALERESGIDLVFTDMVMPGEMTGLDLIAEARRRLPDIKVLFTTGNSSRLRGRDAELPQDAAMLNKPYEALQLAHMVRQCLAGEPAPRSCGPAAPEAWDAEEMA